MGEVRKILTGSRLELAQLVGLEEAKRMVGGIVDFYRVQELRRERYPSVQAPVMHIMFCGNPGTGKRTIAELLGRILKEEGILKDGTLYEAGQAEFLGATMGETARNVREYFEKVKGAVLFIDHISGMAELSEHPRFDAIHALLREMDNHAGEAVVILAGNRKKIDELEQWYPEFCGKTALKVRFPDYTVDELYEILYKLAKKEGFYLQEDVRDSFIQRIMWRDTRKENAKIVRTLLDHAKLNQAVRIMRMPAKQREREMMVLRGEDFERV